MTRADLVEVIRGKHRVTARDGAILVAISGIDAAGKGTIARDVAGRLKAAGLRVALVGGDGWLIQGEKLDLDPDPGVAFYRRGFWFATMFEGVIDPLRRDPAIDVILLEGIFLFKRELRHRYDLSIWIDCAYETALQRALARNQENLPREQLLSDYARIYFPAQEIHLQRDNPREFAEIVFPNDVAETLRPAYSHNF